MGSPAFESPLNGGDPTQEAPLKAVRPVCGGKVEGAVESNVAQMFPIVGILREIFLLCHIVPHIFGLGWTRSRCKKEIQVLG